MLRCIKPSSRNLRLCQSFVAVIKRNASIFKEFSHEQINGSVQNTRTILSNMELIAKRTFSSDTMEDACEPDINAITGGDSNLEHKLRVIMLEIEVMRQEGKAVPLNSSMKTSYWQEILRLPSISARRKYLMYLFKIEKKNENRKKKQEEKRIAWEEKPKREKDDSVVNYDLGGNHIFLRFYDTTMNQMYNNRLIQAIQFGQKLVVDCGFDESMNKRENSNCSKQLMLLFAENRMSDEPFDLHYCNAVPESDLIKGLHKFISTMYEPWFPLNFHQGSYLDCFPKEKLVYLTPHCREPLEEFDHDAIYIIGALVDKVNNEPLTLAKAKKEGLRMAKLPLDRYLDWGAGSGKSLTLNQVAAILLDVKRTGDWKYALRHVPRRKLSIFREDSKIRNFNRALEYTADPNRSKPSWKPIPGNDFNKLNFNRKNDKNVTRLVNLKNVFTK